MMEACLSEGVALDEVRFGSWRLLPSSRSLLSSNQPVKLGSRAFELLLLLVEARGELVTKDELLRRIWPGTVVEENNIQAQMSALRRVLGADAAEFIRTIPGRGYRFTGAVQTGLPPPGPVLPEPPTLARPVVESPARQLPSLRRRDVVAVQKFDVQSGQADHAALASAFVDDLVAELTRLEELRILAPGAPLQINGYRVQGTVRRADKLLRITVQVHDGEHGEIIWSDRCDLPGDAAIPGDLLIRLAISIDQVIARRSLYRARQRPEAELTPRELVLIGRDHHQRATEADTAIAREMFDRAITADPDYALAYAWQALTVQRAVTHLWGGPQGQASRDLLLQLGRRAVDIAPDLPSSLSRLAHCLMLHQRWDEAVDAARAALQGKQWLAYGTSRILCSEVLAPAGFAEEAVEVVERAIAIDPLHGPVTRGMYGRALVLAGRCEEAIPELRWCIAQRPDYVPAYHSLVVACVETGQLDEARAALQQSRRLQPSWVPRNHTGAWFYRRAVDLERFLAAFRAAGDAEETCTAEKSTAEAPGPARTPASSPPQRQDAAADTRSAVIIVHPFEAADSDPDADRLARSLAPGFVARLSRSEDVRVEGRSQPEGFHLRGEVQIAGADLQVLVRLEDAGGSAVLWTESLDHPRDGACVLPGDTINALCIGLERQISAESLRRARKKSVPALSARELCLLGRDHYHRGTEADTIAAEELFGQAMVADPGYAPAFAWQAYTAQRGATHGWGALNGEAARTRALELAQRAVQIDPELPLCLARLAFSLVLHQRWDAAVATARAALRTRRTPGYASITSFGEVLASAGHSEEAVTELQRALSLDPLCPPAMHAVLGRALLLSGRPEEALPELRWCAARLPDYISCYHSIVVAAVETGRLDEARAAYREAMRLQPGWMPRNHSGVWFFRRPIDVERFQSAFSLAGAAAADEVSVAVAAQPGPAVPAMLVPLSRRPVVVVLPFEDIGGDPGRGYFVNGLTIDLVTDLARFQSLHVVCPRIGNGRETADPLKATGREPAEAAGNYVVSGSVRCTERRILVTVHLEDAANGVTLWADRFDRPSDDLFGVLREVSESIAARLVSHVEREQLRRSWHRPTASLDAYDLCLRGRDLFLRMTESDTLRARGLFDQAIATDPAYGPAHTWQANAVLRGLTHWWGEPAGPAALELAATHARRAVDIQPDSSFCLARLAIVLQLQGRNEEAMEAGRAAVQLNPSSSDARICWGDTLVFAGEPEAGVSEIRLGLDLDPFHAPGTRHHLGRALVAAGRHEEALAELRQIAAKLPDFGLCQHNLVVAAVEAGLMDEARAAVRNTLRIGPRWTLRGLEALWPFHRQADKDRFRAAFAAAGMPHR